MGDKEDFLGRQAANARKWHEKISKTHPEHARLYCQHGVYVGSNRLFLSKCESCSPSPKK